MQNLSGGDNTKQAKGLIAIVVPRNNLNNKKSKKGVSKSFKGSKTACSQE